MPKVRHVSSVVLADEHDVLRKYTYEYRTSGGEWEAVEREVYERGDAAAILLYDPARGTVVLTRQFRLPTFVNGNADGMLLECCAGLLDGEDPRAAVERETLEETGYRPTEITKVFEAYTSPGSVTELLHCFIGRYGEARRPGAGGGAEGEHEDIEVVEVLYEEALRRIDAGEIRDAKTIALLYHLRVAGLM